jgi:hypothetical protein
MNSSGRKKQIESTQTSTSMGEVWLQFAVKCTYLDRATVQPLYGEYDDIIGMLVNMSRSSNVWSLP